MSFSLSSNHQYKPWILFLNTSDAPTQGTNFHSHSLAPPLARGGGGAGEGGPVGPSDTTLAGSFTTGTFPLQI